MEDIESIEASGYRINRNLTITNAKGHTMRFQNTNGYPMVGLTVLGERRRYLVHRLFATKFVPNPANHPVVNHIDYDRQNWNPKNLEWTTTQDNVRHSMANILASQCVNRYLLCSPEGEVVEVFNLRDWTRTLGFAYSTFAMLVSGKRKSANGWSLVSRSLSNALDIGDSQ